MNNYNLYPLWLVFTLLFFNAPAAFSHNSGSSYLSVHSIDDELSIAFKTPLNDLLYWIDLDLNQDLKVSVGELKALEQSISTFVFSGTVIKSKVDSSLCVLDYKSMKAEGEARGNNRVFVTLLADINCSGKSEDIVILQKNVYQHNIFHKFFLVATSAVKGGKQQHSLVLGEGDNHPVQFSESQHWFNDLYLFVFQGIYHIFIGFDHILFLLTLVIASIYRLQAGVPLRSKLRPLINASMLFTLAHSVSLVLASFGLFFFVPEHIFEAGIALSVIIMAIHNFKPLFPYKLSAFVILVFGFIHGLGFASVMAELPVNSYNRIISLLGFNIGVEIAQIIIIVLAYPLFSQLNLTFFRKNYALNTLSMIIAGIGFVWLFERVNIV